MSRYVNDMMVEPWLQITGLGDGELSVRIEPSTLIEMISDKIHQTDDLQFFVAAAGYRASQSSWVLHGPYSVRDAPPKALTLTPRRVVDHSSVVLSVVNTTSGDLIFEQEYGIPSNL